MKNILVTGGAGFIGSHTCLSLLENNNRIIVLDSFINSSFKSLEKVKFLLKKKSGNFEKNLDIFQGDIISHDFLYKLFEKIYRENQIDAVIHFAGLKAVAESIRNPINYWETNVFGTINLLKIMDKFSCHNLIFSSSATVYSHNNKLPFDENSLLDPINPYGNTKLSVERLLKDTFNSSPNKWRICNLRYFNPIGAHPSGVIGENPNGEPNNIFPLILNAAFNDSNKFRVFGKDWDTKDGTCIRDYIHVMDLADGHMTSLNYLFKSPPQYININLGTGKGTSILELINAFESVNKVKIPYVFSERRSGDLPEIVADNKKAIELLNWIPKRNLYDMCKDGWNWKCNNPRGYDK